MAHDGQYITLDIIPTVNKDDTSYKAEGSYVDSEKIKVNDGRIENLEGWKTFNIDTPFTGVGRDIHAWKELRQVPHFAVGTHLKLELEQLGTKYDITPVETTVATSNNITTTSGSTSISIEATSHGREVGDYVVFAEVSNVSVGGIDLEGNQFPITTVTDANNYVIDTEVTANANVMSGGGDVTLYHLLENGNQSNGAAFGWGAGTWNTPGATTSSGWNDPRGGDGVEVLLRQWSLDNWGEDLIACKRGGAVYHWDATTSAEVRASTLDAIPLSNNVAFTHPNRHLVLLGTWPVGTSAIDPLEIRWSDRDDFRDVSISAGTRAGSFRLQGGGTEIVGYANTKRETLVFTDDAVWSMTALNNSLVFGFDQLATNVGLLAQHAVVDIDGVVYWMSTRNFYRYDGQITVLENNLDDFIFDNLDFDQKEKTFCGINKDFQEIMWLYQSKNSTTGEVDSYVKYNYKEGSWDIGTLDRTVWQDAGVFDFPIAVDSSGTPYNHNNGNTAAGEGLKSFIETAYFDIGDGTQMMLVDQFIPDFVLQGNLNTTFTVQKWPGGPEVTKGPYNINPDTEHIDLRVRGRQMKVRFSTSSLGTQWGVGKPRYRIKPDGER